MDYKRDALQLVLTKYDVIKSEREADLEKLKKSLANHEKTLIYFGAGILGKSLYAMFQNEGIQADLFCDNNKNLWGGE